jgi:hypothetical protein
VPAQDHGRVVRRRDHMQARREEDTLRGDIGRAGPDPPGRTSFQPGRLARPPFFKTRPPDFQPGRLARPFIKTFLFFLISMGSSSFTVRTFS